MKNLPARARSHGRLVGALSLVLALSGTIACGDKTPVVKLVPATRSAESVTAQPLAFADALERGEAFGHFLIPAPAVFLGQIDKHLNMAESGVRLDEQSLRAQLKGIAGKRKGLAEHIDLSRPFGCVIVDPMPHMSGSTWPGACVLGYTGGAKAFMKDMGKEGRKRRVKGHVGQYDLMGKTIYVDALGDDVVLSGTPDIFAKTKSYLETNLQGRASKLKGAELTLYTAAIFKKYGPMLQPMMQSVLNQPPAPPSGDAKIDASVAALLKYSRKNQGNTLEALQSVEQLNLTINVDGEGLRVSGHGLPSDQASALKTLLAPYAGVIDPTLAANLPSKPALLLVQHAELKAMLESAKVNGQLDLLNELMAIISGNKEDVRGDLSAVADLAAASFTGDIATGMYKSGDDLGAIVSVSRTKSGKTATEFLAQVFEKFPSKRFGADAEKYVTWKYEKNALQVDGVPCDRLVINAGPEAVKALDGESDADLKKLKTLLGGWTLTLYVAQIGDVGVFVAAPKHESEFLKQTFAAITGKGGIEKDPGFSQLQNSFAGNSTGFAVDIAAAKDWVAAMLEGKDQQEARAAKIGANLGDLVVRARMDSSARVSGEFRLSAAVISQISDLVQQTRSP